MGLNNFKLKLHAHNDTLSERLHVAFTGRMNKLFIHLE